MFSPDAEIFVKKRSTHFSYVSHFSSVCKSKLYSISFLMQTSSCGFVIFSALICNSIASKVRGFLPVYSEVC